MQQGHTCTRGGGGLGEALGGEGAGGGGGGGLGGLGSVEEGEGEVTRLPRSPKADSTERWCEWVRLGCATGTEVAGVTGAAPAQQQEL